MNLWNNEPSPPQRTELLSLTALGGGGHIVNGQAIWDLKYDHVTAERRNVPSHILI